MLVTAFVASRTPTDGAALGVDVSPAQLAILHRVAAAQEIDKRLACLRTAATCSNATANVDPCSRGLELLKLGLQPRPIEIASVPRSARRRASCAKPAPFARIPHVELLRDVQAMLLSRDSGIKHRPPWRHA